MSAVNKAATEPHSPVVRSDGNLTEQADSETHPDPDFTFVKSQMTNDARTGCQEECRFGDAMPRVIVVQFGPGHRRERHY